jgi:glycine/D-amino acid oxidase-like deaminating enzyme
MWAVGQPVFHFRPADPSLFRPPRFSVWASDLPRTGWYGFPALADGTLKVANHGEGRRVHPDEPRTVRPEDEARFRAFLRQTFPAAAAAPVVGTRLCLYCDTWDGDFYIDRDPSRPGLIIAAGDSGHAFKFAPVLGSIVADVLEGRPNRWASRFAWRNRGERRWEEARNMPG